MAKNQYPGQVLELDRQMQNLCISTNDIQKQQAILDTLSFDSRAVRHQAIPEAHPGTFTWALAAEDKVDDEEQRESQKLVRWLQQGEGIFWVTGRPGSGKSTFMKHIVDSPETRAALSQWSSPSEPVIASHYFWIFGTPMQKSKEGLLRTLLFEIFRQNPALIKIVCRTRWDESDFSVSAASKPWSIAELRHVLDLVTSPGIGVRTCFFIDGLDEYNGDHLEVSEELVRLSKLRNIKCCISSRPWNVFHDAFGLDGLQNLYLHNLTKRDIRQYVQDRLMPHPRWQRLVDQAERHTQLFEYITEKSHGVFLWVSLVTDRLRSGLTNDDDLSDLSSRLARFPSDLENFFDHILQTVEPFYHEKMAGTLRLARAAEKPLSILSYEFHDAEYPDRDDFADDLPSDSDREKSVQERLDRRLETYYKAPWYNSNGQLEHSPEQKSLRDRVQRRLNAYCKGLLEVHDDRVEFLHRTVADYLCIPDVSERLSTQSAEWYHPELSLARVHLAWIKMQPYGMRIPRRRHAGRYEESALDEYLRAAMALASLHDAECSVLRDKFRALLHDMEASLSRESSPHYLTTVATAYFRERLLQARMPHYVEKMLLTHPNYFADFDRPPLVVILEEGCPSSHAKTIQLLLEHGQDPNEEFATSASSAGMIICKKTPWTVFISLLIRQTRDGLASRLLPHFSACLRAEVFDLFLSHGADANASVYRREDQEQLPTTAWIDILFACFEIERRDEEDYLRVLGRLLTPRHRHSDTSAASVEGVVPVGPESAANVETASETIMKRFFQLAQVLLEFSSSADFVVRVSELVIRRACSAGWSLAAVWPEVRLAFGDAKTRYLKSVYRAERKRLVMDMLLLRFPSGRALKELVGVRRRPKR